MSEADLDFEPEPVESDDVEWVEFEIGAKQNNLAPLWMVNENKRHDPPEWTPKKLNRTVANLGVLLTVDWTSSRYLYSSA